MPKATCTETEFIELWRTYNSARKLSEILNIPERKINARRRRIEERLKINLDAKHSNGRMFEYVSQANRNPARVNLGVENGTVLVFSDSHFWPGIHTTAYRGLLWAIKELQPKAVIANGDVFDGASISRHPRIGWDSTPSVIEELKACEIALGEIEETAKKSRHNVQLVWTLGNHDARFENRLAANAPQYEHVKGFSLKDHFPAWKPCWSAWITDDVVAKHRWKGGIHATHNNTVGSGKTMITGHLHSLKVTPYADYNGNRFGIDTGTLAEIDGPQFMDYLEDAPVNWRSGFAVLSFKDGKLLWPELVHKWADGQIEFRGQVINV